jgi:hypothetical protein
MVVTPYPYLESLRAAWVEADSLAAQLCDAADATRRVPLLVTVLTYEHAAAINTPPSPDHPTPCAVAFVNRLHLHSTAGWTQVPINQTIGGVAMSRSRLAHLAKIPLLLTRTMLYMDGKYLGFRAMAHQQVCPARSVQLGQGADVAVTWHPKAGSQSVSIRPELTQCTHTPTASAESFSH